MPGIRTPVFFFWDQLMSASEQSLYLALSEMVVSEITSVDSVCKSVAASLRFRRKTPIPPVSRATTLNPKLMGLSSKEGLAIGRITVGAKAKYPHLCSQKDLLSPNWTSFEQYSLPSPSFSQPVALGCCLNFNCEQPDKLVIRISADKDFQLCIRIFLSWPNMFK
jgi:hypothetical protein